MCVDQEKKKKKKRERQKKKIPERRGILLLEDLVLGSFNPKEVENITRDLAFSLFWLVE